MDIKTFIFLDCETTGLPVEENFKTKITELCLTAVRSDHILSGKVPRVQNKLSLCFDPKKSINPIATKFSQLSNTLLYLQPVFDKKIANMINEFISLQCQPVCLVAHNGDGFDYPLIQTELRNAGVGLPEHVLCIDSLCIFKDLYYEDTGKVPGKKAFWKSKITGPARSKKNVLAIQTSNKREADEEVDLNSSGCLKKLKFSSQEVIDIAGEVKEIEVQPTENYDLVKQFCFKSMKIPSFKLSKMYKTITSKKPIDAHQAENDVNMLIACAAILNRRFVNYANAHAIKFQEIEMMGPKNCH